MTRKNPSIKGGPPKKKNQDCPSDLNWLAVDCTTNQKSTKKENRKSTHKAVKINPIYWCIASNSKNNTKNSRCIQTRTYVSRMRNQPFRTQQIACTPEHSQPIL